MQEFQTVITDITSGTYKYTFFDILNWNFVNIFPSSYSFMIFPLIYRE